MDTRFGHLLQPIRDLAQNWDIDIASELENYLTELEQLVVTFDCGATTMNFAEAALLIQGSACIYSRKVEYLYSLVYQALELMASKRKQTHTPSVDEQGRDRDITGFDKHKEQFLSLDDIKESKKVDLPENWKPKEIDPVPRTPMSLLPYREDEKTDCALVSTTGEILGNRKDFKMNTSIFHASGAVLIDLSHVDNVEQIYRQLIDRTRQTAVDSDADRNQNEMLTQESAVERVPAPFQEEAEEVGFDGFGDCGGDAESPEKKEMPVEEKVDRMTRQRANQQAPSILHCLPSMADPWQFADPHDPSGVIERPFKKGKPYRVPPHLTEEQPIPTGKKRKRNNAKKPPPPLECLWEFCRRTLYSSEASLPKNPLKAPAFVEFQDLFWAEQKRRDRWQKKEKKMLSRVLGDWQEFFPHEDGPDVEENQTDEVLANDDVADGGWHGDDWEGGGGESMSPVGVEEPIELVEPLHVSKPAVMQNYETLVKQHVQLQLIVAQKYAQETELSRRVREWEENMTPILSKEEEHNPFDIHSYGEKILCQLEQLGMQDSGSSNSHVPLCKLTRDKKPFEVCRVLLASLQLANSENIEISRGSMDNATFRLRSKDMPHGRFDTYRVPSYTVNHNSDY